jgi:hypothetical protein
MVIDSAEEHFLCYDNSGFKMKWEEAMDKGQKQFCPNCKIGGQKDDACTHMVCEGCDTEWCYFCGLSLEDCDKAEQGN